MKFDGFENWPVMYTLFGFRLQIQLMLFLIQSDHLSEKFIIFFFIFLSLSLRISSSHCWWNSSSINFFSDKTHRKVLTLASDWSIGQHIRLRAIKKYRWKDRKCLSPMKNSFWHSFRRRRFGHHRFHGVEPENRINSIAFDESLFNFRRLMVSNNYIGWNFRGKWLEKEHSLRDPAITFNGSIKRLTNNNSPSQ